ncbi:hypothetical protein BC826DRAFT_1080055 [Russula brevipes]|nr:hypothetical protein BC826DRAFT_1080055 [Russula brevipes]
MISPLPPEVSLSRLTNPIDPRSVNAILDNLTYASPKRNILFVTDAFVESRRKGHPDTRV